MEICYVDLVEQLHFDECGNFVGMCKSSSMSMAKFCGYEYGWHFLYWSWNFDYGKLLLSMRFWL